MVILKVYINVEIFLSLDFSVGFRKKLFSGTFEEGNHFAFMHRLMDLINVFLVRLNWYLR